MRFTAVLLLCLVSGAVQADDRYPLVHERLARAGSPGAVIVRSGAQSGMASIYAVPGRDRYAGRRTACGTIARPNGLTAAHKTLPCGTMVRVTNQRNGRSVALRIEDRGPFVRGRIVDVTPAGARALGFSGLAPVTLERL